MTATIHSILEQFRQDAASNRALGDKFERLIMFSGVSGLREYFDVFTTDVSGDFVTAIRQMAA